MENCACTVDSELYEKLLADHELACPGNSWIKINKKAWK